MQDQSTSTPERFVETDEWAVSASASKIAAMLGLGKYDSPKSLGLKMVHPEKFPRGEMTKAQARGTFLEDGMIALWYSQNPRFKRTAEGELTYRTDEYGFPAVATPDGECIDTEADDERIGVECKTVNSKVIHEWGTPGTDEVPAYYLIQVIWQQILSGVRRTAVIRNGPFIDDQETYWINFDADLAAIVLDTVKAFMSDVAKGIVSPNDDRPETFEAIRKVFTDFDPADEEWPIDFETAIEHTLALADFERASGRLNLSKSNVFERIGNAKKAVIELPAEIGKNGKPKKAKLLTIASRQRVKGGGVTLVKPRTPVDVGLLRELQAAAAAVAEAEAVTVEAAAVDAFGMTA